MKKLLILIILSLPSISYAEDLIKINTYVVDLDSTRSKAVQAAKAKYFTQEHQPASTMVGVSALVMKPLLVEIEATAVVEA